MNKDKLDFTEVIKKLEDTKPLLPYKLATTAQNYFMNCFRKEQFDGTPWQEVQRRIPGFPEYKYPKGDTSKNKRGILRGRTRDLYGAVSHCIREVNWERIVLGIDIPYGQYHNEGTDKIPKRQFMGDAKELRDKLDKQITDALNQVFK